MSDIDDLIGTLLVSPAPDGMVSCMGCGVSFKATTKVRLQTCPACWKRIGKDMTMDERYALLHTDHRHRTIFQLLEARKRKTFLPTEDRLRIPKAYAAAVAEFAVAEWSRTPVRPLVLSGLPGRGKTHQACGALRALLKSRHGEGFLVSCVNLATMSREEFAAWSKAGALALDDFGSKLTPAAISNAFALIDHRISERKPLIVTTNITMDGIIQIDERIGSRLRGGIWMELNGPDRRAS